MSRTVKRLLFWTPRILCLLFSVFISLFALDVFGEGYDIWETIVAFFMHMVPTFVILLVLALAWRWEWVGAVLFCALGALYIVVFRDDPDLIAYLMISGPLFLTAALFLVGWVYRAEVRDRD